MQLIERLKPWLRDVASIPWRDAAITLRERFREDRLGLTASSLTFTTIIALVPLITVGLAVFTAFPMFAKFQDVLQKWLIESLVPDNIARQVLGYLNQFAGKASRLGVAGLAILLGTALALLLAGAAAFLKWQDAKVRDSEVARAESVQVAKDSTIRLLSYKPDTVEQELTSARDLLTGNFRDSYTQLTNDVVIPGAKEKKIAAMANVPAVASISATPSQAVALVFVNQTVTVGNDAPTSTNSSACGPRGL